MALAILELVGVERRGARFKIDCGTNRYWQLRIGRRILRRGGVDWADGVVSTTPVLAARGGSGLLNSAQEITVPIEGIDEGKAYVQLFSFKGPAGGSPAFSSVVVVPLARGLPSRPPVELVPPLSSSVSVSPMQPAQALLPPRKIPCRTFAETYSQPASLDQLLAGIVKVAVPVVLNLLGGPRDGGAGTSAASGSGVAGVLALLLKALLGGDTGAVMPGQMASLPEVRHRLNGGTRALAQPFFFGIDDAALATAGGSLAALLPALMPLLQQLPSVMGPMLQQLPAVMGPVLQQLPAVMGPLTQMLPQLLNGAQQSRLELKQADNKLIKDAMSEVNRRILLERLIEAQRTAAPAGGALAPDLASLIALLSQAQPSTPADTATALPPAPAPALAKSQSTASRGAILAFETSNLLPWEGAPRAVFMRDRAMHLRLRLVVADPAPRVPLPKAILTLVFKDDADQRVLLEKELRLERVTANSVVEAALDPSEVARLPAHRSMTLFAELRWPGADGRKIIKALGSLELVVMNKYLLGEQGSAVSPERELVDMQRFRSFWNKVWEAPMLSGSGGKTLWGLDVGVKYSVLLTPDHPANGLMETKLLQTEEDDSESLTRRTEGRMKAGIELSLPELNKLLPLWEGESMLDAEHLEALRTAGFARRNAGEAVAVLKLKGRRDERGMVWVVPTFKLFEAGLRTPDRIAETGQVLSTAEEKVRFPLPVSVRLLGLKSGEPREDAEYVFDGFAIEVSEKYVLEPPEAMGGKGSR